MPMLCGEGRAEQAAKPRTFLLVQPAVLVPPPAVRDPCTVPLDLAHNILFVTLSVTINNPEL